MKILHESSSHYPYGNNYIGFGIPDIPTVLDLIDEKDFEKRDQLLEVDKRSFKMKIEGLEMTELLVYHKSDDRKVIERDIDSNSEGEI